MAHSGPRVVIRGIFERQDRNALVDRCPRATLVLEQELYPLERGLTGANFTVVVREDAAMSKQRKLVLAGRTLITRNTAAFLDDAPGFNAGIIGLDALADIHIGPTLSECATAVLISKAFSAFDLGSERGSYLLLLYPRGRHVFRWLG